MYITYEIKGRFGNNLFQYLTMKIIQNKLLDNNRDYKYVYNNVNTDDNTFIINDDNYKEILENINIIPFCNNIYLDGYFISDTHIIENKEFIKTIINDNNNENINDIYRVKDISESLAKYKYYINNDDNELIMHIRLDDFLEHKICMNIENYFKYIPKLPSHLNKIVIIIDKINKEWEMHFIYYLIKCIKDNGREYQIEINNELLRDFSRIYYSKNFFSSNSTFSYMAGLLGEHTLTWCPTNKTIYPQYIINKFDNNTVTIEPTYYQVI